MCKDYILNYAGLVPSVQKFLISNFIQYFNG